MTGAMGPMGPVGPAGSVPSGTLVFLLNGAPVPADYDYVGSVEMDVYPTPRTSGRARRVVVDVYKKR